MWGLLIILAGDPLHRLSWYTTQEACERRREIEATRHQLAGR
jgi:hypothetical protein